MKRLYVLVLLILGSGIGNAQIAYVRGGTEILRRGRTTAGERPAGNGKDGRVQCGRGLRQHKAQAVVAIYGSFRWFTPGVDTRKVVQVTRLENEFARTFSVSPDGKSIAWERAKTVDKDQEADLWIVGVDGSNMKLLVRNGFEPSWAR
jgi:hypothetical protein